MPVNTRAKIRKDPDLAELTGTWDSPGLAPETEEEVTEEVEEAETASVRPKTSAFVRCVGPVGQYPAGSVLPATAFEYLENLLKLGAVEYDFEATEEKLGGDEQTQYLLASTKRPVALTVPQAPWISASAANLLGATYLSQRYTRVPS